MMTKILSDHVGLPITYTGTMATITMSFINEHITVITGVLTAIYTIACIVYMIAKTVTIFKHKKDKK